MTGLEKNSVPSLFVECSSHHCICVSEFSVFSAEYGKFRISTCTVAKETAVFDKISSSICHISKHSATVIVCQWRLCLLISVTVNNCFQLSALTVQCFDQTRLNQVEDYMNYVQKTANLLHGAHDDQRLPTILHSVRSNLLCKMHEFFVGYRIRVRSNAITTSDPSTDPAVRIVPSYFAHWPDVVRATPASSDPTVSCRHSEFCDPARLIL